MEIHGLVKGRYVYTHTMVQLQIRLVKGHRVYMLIYRYRFECLKRLYES